MPLIRPGIACDVPEIFRIRTEVCDNALNQEQLTAKGITPEAIVTLITESECCWVACVENQCVGFAIIDLEQGAIFALFIDPKYQGGGIGSALLTIAEQRLFRHHSTLWLETDSQSPADGFYRKQGWSPVQALCDNDMRYEKSRSSG